jgi:hypothetical protein
MSTSKTAFFESEVEVEVTVTDCNGSEIEALSFTADGASGSISVEIELEEPREYFEPALSIDVMDEDGQPLAADVEVDFDEHANRLIVSVTVNRENDPLIDLQELVRRLEAADKAKARISELESLNAALDKRVAHLSDLAEVRLFGQVQDSIDSLGLKKEED